MIGRLSCCLVAVMAISPMCVNAQDTEEKETTHMVNVTPKAVTLPVGESVQLEAEVVDVGGRPVEDVQVFFFSQSRREVSVDRKGKVTARRPGQFTVIARALIPGGNRRNAPSAEVTITIPFPKPEKISFPKDAKPVL